MSSDRPDRQSGNPDPGAANVFHPSSSLREAETLAHRLGVVADYAPAGLAIANFINEALTNLTQRGQSLPPTLRCERSRGDMAEAILSFDPVSETLVVNRGHPYWTDPMGRFQSPTDDWFASNDPFGLVYHEVGHWNHWRAIGRDRDRWLIMRQTPLPGPIRRVVRAEVGFYAMTSGVDFVAEVYHGWMTGRRYSNGVMRLYTELGGPSL